MTRLWDLAQDMQAVAELVRDPEMEPQALTDTLEGLEGMFNEKAVRLVYVLLNQGADVEAIDAEIKRLTDRKKTMQAGADRLKEYLRYNMEASGINKIESPMFTITLAKGRDIAVVDDPEALPDHLVEHRTTIQPDKRQILKELQQGPVEGARLEKSKTSVRIK